MPPRGVNCRIWVRGDRGRVGVGGLGPRESAAWSETETVGDRAQRMRMVGNGRARFGAARNLTDVAAEVGNMSGRDHVLQREKSEWLMRVERRERRNEARLQMALKMESPTTGWESWGQQ
ncbi:hypothetical protein EDB85DRAFT_1899236 [Lactarius pseudohatsudake]|nr:hypothetical protein EDB85DRAFT_1899236 [Lactarius pseudohatsudake]